MNSQEELERCLHFIVKAAKNHYSDVSPVMSPGDAKWADELPKLIEAEASRREQAAEERVLDEFDSCIDLVAGYMHNDALKNLRKYMNTKRQSLKEKKESE